MSAQKNTKRSEVRLHRVISSCRFCYNGLTSALNVTLCKAKVTLGMLNKMKKELVMDDVSFLECSACRYVFEKDKVVLGKDEKLLCKECFDKSGAVTSSPAQETESLDTNHQTSSSSVVITDINIRFESMVALVFKFFLATFIVSIPFIMLAYAIYGMFSK